MCTATFIKDKEQNIIFTTNRDEHASRPTLSPELYEIRELKMLFPKDELAGGSWVAVSEKGLICCVMNGAEGEREWLGTQANKSRGQVLLDAFQFSNASTFLSTGDFEEAHPFTLLWIDPNDKQIYAIKWNGSKKWMDEYPQSQAHIWSAYTLYPEDQRKARENTFKKWVKEEENHHSEAVLQFHAARKEKDGLLLSGTDTVNTVSTTQLLLNPNSCEMIYQTYHEKSVNDKIIRSLELS